MFYITDLSKVVDISLYDFGQESLRYMLKITNVMTMSATEEVFWCVISIAVVCDIKQTPKSGALLDLTR